jgi:hypothetical protein
MQMDRGEGTSLQEVMRREEWPGHVRQAGVDSRFKLRRHGRVGGGWKVVYSRCTARERDRRHGGLCSDRSAAIKPCACGAPLRGCGA